MFKKTLCLLSLIVLDIAALFCSLFLAYLIRKEILVYVYPAFRMWTFPFSTYLVNYPYFVGLWVVVLAWALSLFFLPALRVLAKKILSRAGIWKRNILIVGAGRTGEMVLGRIKGNKNMGYEPVGFLDDDEAKLGRKIGGVKVLGKLSEIKSWVKEKKVGDDL